MHQALPLYPEKEMAPVPQKTVEHFTHPGHRLVELHADAEYLCDGCKTLGHRGTRYRCHECDFDLHDYCATCPRILSSFMHPPHQLSLVVRKAQATRQNVRVCSLCGDHVEGMFYRCKDCDFDAHPLCTQLPQHLRHALHPAHPLTLQESMPGRCAVCGGACSSWRYRCGACGFDIHLECVLAPCGPSTSRSAPPCGPIPPQPQPPYYGGYAYGAPPAVYSAFNYNNMYHNGNLAQGGGATSGGAGKLMSALVVKLGVGVLSNVIFGTSNIDFSSFL